MVSMDQQSASDNETSDPNRDNAQQVDPQHDLPGHATDEDQQNLRLVEGEQPPVVTAESIVEAILFSTDQPLPATRIGAIVGGLGAKRVREIIEQFNERYRQSGSAFRIEHIAGGYQMMTLPQFSPWLEQLHRVRSESKLSKAALETLAVVAYRQPVTRAQIEAIRGVACGEVLRSLMDKGLIKIVGRAEELGRPMLYGTTRKFLEVFGLSSLDDLPQIEELQPPAQPSAPPAEQSPDQDQASDSTSD